jgi:hypothetical protein
MLSFTTKLKFIVDTGLTTGTFYAFRVVAVNAVGDSPLSTLTSYIAAAVPGAPG